ncbi:FAD-binding domain [Arthrobacter stackebrandtii]|uniref:FAD-binding domain n=1 Tax=Arthrobacter stackebrandtii TaxID=272161 RepID=UPI000D9AD1EA|nr:hypothetical protein CVV67_01005 [Arthrobacter stackebrandtii]
MKILIVGAGIAGPAVAYWLNRAGHQTTIVEHASELRGGGYIVDFWGAGFDVAKKMGIVPQLMRRGYVMTEARTVNRNGHRLATLKTEKILEAAGRYVSVARSDLASVICDALDGNTELIFDDTVMHLDDDDQRVRVTFRSGTTQDFDLVVGADGLHSRVRQLAFGPDADFEKYLGMVVACFETTSYWRRNELAAIMYAGVGFQATRLSLRDDSTMILFSLRHDGELPATRVEQERLVRAKLADQGWELPAMLELMSKAKDFYFDAVSQIRMPQWSSGRVALVGDAAACPSFLAGQGSALAVVEAYTLAAELAATQDHRLAFSRYHDRLAAFLLSKQDAAVGLGLAFAPKNRLQLATRNVVMKLMALPKVADLAMGKSFHDAVELPHFAAHEQ